jgi:hypothetical protein
LHATAPSEIAERFVLAVTEADHSVTNSLDEYDMIKEKTERS